ncbi:MAG: valine--tRNA ligase [Limisphaerales bacterium]
MNEIPKAYEPQSVEDKWYDFWVKQGCFTADPARVSEKRPAFSIVIPPPNVTGMLHMGHVLNNTIQDILSRKARMDGKEVLWLPGTDHAGIATQVQVEKALKKEERKTKYDLGREEFLKRVWQWKEKHGGIIINQLKKLGCSCDWTRERFTMDADYSRCVQKVFVKLYKKGLIYRGKRMVNWCPVSQTALSDEEVEMKPQKGFMYHFKVEVAEAPGTWLTIATTRPETIPGDTAVAVNPKDPRYAPLIGKHIIRPLPIQLPREQKLIPIIGDEHVDFEFGTGVLKVTPAHDKADFEIGQRHKLPIVDIMNANGTMNDLAGESLAGLDRFEARKVAVERLKELAVMVEEKPYENNVGFSQRADVPIEPRLSEQWFLKYPSVEQSKACVANGQMKFYPDRWAKVYDHWLTNIQDWCISRQLWWGHQIPVWTFRKNICLRDAYIALKHILEQAAISPKELSDTAITIDGQSVNSDIAELHRLIHSNNPELDTFLGGSGRTIVVSTSVESLQRNLDLQKFRQDPDVLDTWFSSWLWPFATMGWPEQTETLKKFYPTTDLVTGPDIIFFWVARMIMAGYEFMGDLPFKNVYFTGIIRDKQGRKMSKTLGNSPDPLELIARYGADALRFGTMRSAPLGQDVLFDEKDVELGRNFCNKLWNACRFRQMVGSYEVGGMRDERKGTADSVAHTSSLITHTFEIQGEINAKLLSSDDRWILLRLDLAIREVSEALTGYNFATAVQSLYRFFWSEYCDWYVEASKAAFFAAGRSRGDETQTSPEESQRLLTSSPTDALAANKVAVIDFVLSHLLRMFHPLLPFITEELWHGMGYAADMPEGQGGKTIMYAPWPKPLSADEKEAWGLDDTVETFANAKFELVTQGRNLKTQFNIGAGKKGKFTLKPAGQLDPSEAEVLRLLLSAESLELDPNYAPKKGTPTALTRLGELYLPLDGLIDVDAERARLTKDLAKVQAEIEKVEQKLANPGFTQKVPPAVLDEHKQRLADWQAKLAQTKAAIEALG